MRYGTTRISSSAQGILRDLAKADGRSMVALLDEAVEALRRQRFLTDLNTAYAKLRADPDAWAELENERRAWDRTLSDGLAAAERAPRYSRSRGRRRKRR
jgi:hypothetical protein